MNNPKNQLQECCQKNKTDMPQYKTIRIDKNNDHEPIWKSSININGTVFSGTASSKKGAELNAAEKAYKKICNGAHNNGFIKISNNSNNRKQKVNGLEDIDFNRYKKVLLVDGENANVDYNYVGNDMCVLIFVAKNTTKNIVFELQEKYNNCYVFISECVGRDASDHMLSFYAGQLEILNKNLVLNYYVLTKDHYGEFLGKFMKNCKFICMMEEVNA